MKKIRIPLFAVLALVAAAAFAVLYAVGCGGVSRASETPVPPPGEAWIDARQAADAGIAVEKAALREVGAELVLPGRLTFDDQRVTHVFSPVTGRVTRMVAPLGARVKAGDPLAVIESPDLGSAASDLAKARADLEAAERDWKRTKELWEAHAASERDHEAAESRYRQALAERERAEKKVRLLHAGSDGPSDATRVTQEYVLRSRIDGEVIARAANPGMEVQGQYSGGNAVELYTIGAADRLWVLADVYEADFPRVKAGARARVKVVTWPDRTFEGTIDWVSGAIDPVSRTMKVRCALDNRDGALKPEMYATVTLSVPGRTALAIPRGAVYRMGEATVAFVSLGATPAGARRFAIRPVRIDGEGETGPVAVLAGLSEGEEVVASNTVLVAGKLNK